MKETEKRAGSACETRCKHKLNMLEPGTKMLKGSAILGALGLVLLLLFGLLAIEAHRNRVLNELALREDRERERGEGA